MENFLMTTLGSFSHHILVIRSLWWREMVRFFRQRNRVIGALATPVLFWVFLGSGVGKTFQSGTSMGDGYLLYFFPGSMLLILLFTAIFASISIIEDRHTGFLQSVLAAPTPRLNIAMGKIFGGAAIALIQSLLFYILAPCAGFAYQWLLLPALAAVLFLIAIQLSALGYFIAWQTDSVQGFHAMMNLLLMPMWLMSGALFPVEGAASWMQWIIRLNPAYYGLEAIRHLMDPTYVSSLGLCWDLVITAWVTVFLCLACGWISRRAA
jgi:ABC-2 type transport system permease protein